MRRDCATNYGNGKIVPIPRLHKVRQLMLKRPFKSLIARIAIVALALSLVVPFVPAAFAQDTSIPYAEGGTGPVATFTATDADGDAIVWSLSGADAEDFTIVGGVLAFKSSPDYESPGDAGSDNTYNVTLEASGGSSDVVVTVTNVDEMGTVDINDLQPQAGEPVGADVSDEDGSLEQTRWQWSKSMDQAAWEDISGASSPTYTPETGDIGYYLRATATYSDGLGTGRDTASAVTVFAVEKRPVANAQPAFADDEPATPDSSEQTRMLKETAKGGSSVGNAVTASDSDNDPLLYSMDGGAAIDLTGISPTENTTADADDLFAIDNKSGQISVKSGANTDYLDREKYFTTAAADPEPAKLEYEVMVKATDPSGSEATVTVTIQVTPVDEAPIITLVTTGLTDQQTATITTPGQTFVVTTPEQDPLALQSRAGSEDEFSLGLPVFDANDPEEATDPNVDKITWSISGADAKRFQIAELDTPNTGYNSSAALRWATADRKGPSFEAMDSADGDNAYLVTVTAFDGVASKSQAVSITVRNVEEDGSIKLSQLTPQVGRAITARLSDPDGGITGAEWQWYRGVTDTADLPDTADATEKCDADTLTNCWIEGATSSTYTPRAADATGAGTDDPPTDPQKLTVVAKYTDAYVTDVVGDDGTGDAENPNANDVDDGDMVIETTDNAAKPRPDENAQPTFGDDESVDRSVEENANKANVGEPVTATDGDNDALIYTLSGDGSDAFSVNNSGQITTAEELDFETQSSYTVTVTATDPSGANDSIVVNITVTDADDAATISAGSSIPYAENGTEPVATFTATDADGDAIVWSLSGADAEDFTIVGGELAFKSSPNYESPGDEGADNIYNVTLQASGGSRDVVVNVTNVDEMGSVDINDLQPQAGESVGASVSDEDGSLEQTRWQWSKSMDQAVWEDISGASSPTYTPETGDIGYYLRATATYSDGLGTGRDSADAMTVFAVEKRPVANAQPAFADDEEEEGAQQTRMLKETAKGGSSVGNAVTASDSDNDPLLYSMDGGAAINLTGIGDTAATTADADDLFAIDDKSGQISVKSGANTDYLDREKYFTTAAADPEPAKLEYEVMVKATDPSGSMATVTVTIQVTPVDEAPVITLVPAGLTDQQTATITTPGQTFVVTTPEQDPLALQSRAGSEDEFSLGLPVFDANDPEEATDPNVDKITWSISGADAKRLPDSGA